MEKMTSGVEEAVEVEASTITTTMFTKHGCFRPGMVSGMRRVLVVSHFTETLLWSVQWPTSVSETKVPE